MTVLTVDQSGRSDQSPGPSDASADGHGRDGWWYVGAVVVGAGLNVAAAINQPYNQNELEQTGPYHSDDIHRIIHGTRQPPLDPLLGALVQHLLGEGQLRQRLVPVLAGVGTLVLMGLLLRRFGLGRAGAVGLWVMATQPIMVQYSAYARPYAVPLFLMMLFTYSAQRWLRARRAGWLGLAAVAAGLLPLSRVPEPTVFLVTSGLALAWLAVRRRRTWSTAGPLILVTIGALVFVGSPMYHSLASRKVPLFDPSISGVVARFDNSADQFQGVLVPSLGNWFPLWPVIVVLLAAALVLPTPRHKLLHECGWAWWPLALPPVAFLLAYYFANPHSLELRPYRDRYAYFFIPALVFVVAAVAVVLEDNVASARVRVPVGVLLAAALVGQLPATARVLTDNTAPDFQQAAAVIDRVVPADGSVLYLTPSTVEGWREPFIGQHRYLDRPRRTPAIVDAGMVPDQPGQELGSGPVYTLVLDAECSSSALCDGPAEKWKHDVAGWRVVSRFDHFTLYEPTAGQSGRHGVIEGLLAYADAFGPELGLLESLAAAAVLKAHDRSSRGRALVHRAYADMGAEATNAYRYLARQRGLDPFRRGPS